MNTDDLQALYPLDITDWAPELDASTTHAIHHALESGQVLVLPALEFKLSADEKRFLSPRWLDGSRKNISLEGHHVGGAKGSSEELDALNRMLARYAEQSSSLVHRILPGYQAHLSQARTSFRPSQVEGIPISWKKDDSRLHVDAFPSRPTHGERILRIFNNVNPHFIPRVWRVGEPFEASAKFFQSRIPPYRPAVAKLMHALHITKSVRSEYDHFMLHMHDQMKADLAYQREVTQQSVPFMPGTTWICFSDQVLHAAMSGQYMFEQTFHLPVSALQHPELSPLRVLENLLGKPLTA